MKRYGSEKQRVREYVESRLTTGDYDRVVDVLSDAQRGYRWTPSRSTFYAWVKSWREKRADDQSGIWTLAADGTGRPDVVLRVLAALYESSGGRRGTVTIDQARWLAKLAAALPAEWPDEVRTIFAADGSPRTVTISGALRLLGQADHYLSAERHYGGDAELMAQTDLMTAVEWWTTKKEGD